MHIREKRNLLMVEFWVKYSYMAKIVELAIEVAQN